MIKLEVSTGSREEVVDITSLIQNRVREDGLKSGICVVYVPHTTAAVWINENADPDVPRAILYAFREFVPTSGFHHAEGNSPAHVRSVMVGESVTVPVEDGRLMLGRWQGIQFGEFDGPRNRQVWVQLVGD